MIGKMKGILNFLSILNATQAYLKKGHMSEKTQIGGVMSNDGLVLISVLAIPAKPGTAGRVMSAMGENDLNVEFITQTTGLGGKDHILFCIKQENATQVMDILNRLKHDLEPEQVTRRDNVGIVFAFGPDFRYLPGIAGDVFRTLGQIGVNIISISTSISTISCVIDGSQVAQAVAALEEAFETP